MDTKTKKPKPKKKISIPFLKEIVLVAVNLCLIFILFFVVHKLNITAMEIKNLRNSGIEVSSKYAIDTTKARIKENEDKIKFLNNIFVDESRLVSFVGAIDELKRDGLVTGFSFASDKPITDKKTGLDVLPFTIQMVGDTGQINYSLGKVYNLPYLTRDVIVEIEKNSEDSTIEVSYGGYIYVNREFGKN